MNLYLIAPLPSLSQDLPPVLSVNDRYRSRGLSFNRQQLFQVE